MRAATFRLWQAWLGGGLLLAMLLGGCATDAVPKEALRLPETALELRSLQTRTLSAPSEIDILAAAVAVLQDMEFNIDRIEKPLGVITASKVSDADSKGEKTGLFFLDMLCAAGGSGNCDYMSTAQDEQHITLTMVVLPSLERSEQYSVRVTLQRIIFDKMDRVRVRQQIADAETYQQIFDNLLKSLFIQVGES